MKVNEPPSCEWPDPKGGLQLHNCDDADGCPDAELTSRAIGNRIGQISKQLDCPHGLTNKERKALAHERGRLRRYLESISPPAIPRKDMDVPHMKAEKKKLLWLAKKSDRESGLI